MYRQPLLRPVSGLGDEGWGESAYNAANLAFQAKAQGNEFYRQGHLQQALSHYDRAISLDPGEAAYYSNRQACLFDMGSYAASIQDGRVAENLFRDKMRVGLSSRHDVEVALTKIYKRIARALLCIGTKDRVAEARGVLVKALQLRPDDIELMSMLKGADIKPPVVGDGSIVPEQLPRYRPSEETGVKELSMSSNELAVSALAGRVVCEADGEVPLSAPTDVEDEDDGTIHLIDRPEGERRVHLMFGALGDGRALFATLRDVFHQVQASEGRLPYSSIDLSCILNDINAEYIARTLVLLRAMLQLGEVLTLGEGQSALEAIKANPEAAEAAYRVYHLYLGAFLLPKENEWLLATLREMGDAGSLCPSWLSMDKETGEAVAQVCRHWAQMAVATEEVNDTMARCYVKCAQQDDGGEGGEFSKERAEYREEMLEEIRRQIAGMSEEELDRAGAVGESLDEKREALCQYWGMDVDPRTLGVMQQMPRVHGEMKFHVSTLILPVPLAEAMQGGLLEDERGMELHHDWRANVTMLSADGLERTHGSWDPHFCPFATLRRLLSLPEDEGLFEVHRGYELAAVFFGEVALALQGLLQNNALHFEAILGDAHDVPVRSSLVPKAVEAGGLDRILMSNIPDITTLVPTFVHLMPLLKQNGRATLRHTVLRAPSSFEDVSEYSHSHSFVPDLSSMPFYLGANHEYGGIWGHFIEWSNAAKVHEKEMREMPMSFDVAAWLTTFFLSIVMPIQRDGLKISQPRPLTANAFMEVIHYLRTRLDFPPHALAGALEPLLLGQMETVAIPPDQSPWPTSMSWRARKWQSPKVLNCQAFALEVRTLLGLWIPQLGFCVCPPPGVTVPSPADILTVDVTFASTRGRLDRKSVVSVLLPTVGAALVSPTFAERYSALLGPTSDSAMAWEVPSSMSASTDLSSSSPPPAPESLRSHLLSAEAQKEGHVHLLSAVRWDSTQALLQFMIGREDLQALVAKGFKVLVLRTDSWKALTTPVDLTMPAEDDGGKAEPMATGDGSNPQTM